MQLHDEPRANAETALQRLQRASQAHARLLITISELEAPVRLLLAGILVAASQSSLHPGAK